MAGGAWFSFMRKNPSYLNALAHELVMCLSRFKSCENVTAKYFTLSTGVIVKPLRLYANDEGHFFLVGLMNAVL